MPIIETPILRSSGRRDVSESRRPQSSVVQEAHDHRCLGCPCSRPHTPRVQDAQLSVVQDAP